MVAADLTGRSRFEKPPQVADRVVHAPHAAASFSSIIIEENLREILECHFSGLPTYWVAERRRLQPFLQKDFGLGSTARVR